MTSKAITTTATTALRIGLFGGGIVGGGVIELLQKYNQRTSTELGLSIEVVKICVRSIEKPRDFKYDPNAIKLVTNYQDILGDPSINCVIELMGGIVVCYMMYVVIVVWNMMYVIYFLRVNIFVWC